MFAGDEAADAKVNNIIQHLSDKKTTITHGRHIGLAEAKKISGDHIVELEADQELQDLMLTVHHASIITLQATPCYKMMENHLGKGIHSDGTISPDPRIGR
jgi:hypothetical protein